MEVQVVLLFCAVLRKDDKIEADGNETAVNLDTQIMNTMKINSIGACFG